MVTAADFCKTDHILHLYDSEVARITCGTDTTQVGRYRDHLRGDLTESFLHFTRFLPDTYRLPDHAS